MRKMDEGCLTDLSVHQLRVLLERGEVAPRDVHEAYVRRIEEVDDQLNAYITVCPDFPPELENRHGRPVFPVAVKDNIMTRGIRTTCGSRILARFIPPYDATAILRLKERGLYVLGKTNMDEFAMGSSCENSAFGPTRNPWNLDAVPGGSSGGSAAAVAAGEAPWALGSDTGGSVRQPAALCGVVGMKPTYGRVSRFGLVAFASSLDQIGPITRDVWDCWVLMRALCGHDPLDSTSAPGQAPIPPPQSVESLGGVRIGVPREYLGPGVEDAVRDAVLKAVGVLEELGARAEECSLPHTEYGLSAYYIIAPAEASSNLARYDGVRYGHRTCQASSLLDMYELTRQEGFGAEVKRRIMLGTYVLSAGYYDAYYLRAQKVRTLICRDFERAWARYDLLAAPTSPTVAFPLGERTADPLAMYMADVLTIPVNLAGLPALSLPCGFARGLPVGLQLIGRPFDELTLLRVAQAFQQATDYHLYRPVVGGEVDG